MTSSLDPESHPFEAHCHHPSTPYTTSPASPSLSPASPNMILVLDQDAQRSRPYLLKHSPPVHISRLPTCPDEDASEIQIQISEEPSFCPPPWPVQTWKYQATRRPAPSLMHEEGHRGLDHREPLLTYNAQSERRMKRFLLYCFAASLVVPGHLVCTLYSFESQPS